MGTESWRSAPRRVFGWAVYLEVPDPRESAALRAAAAAVIAGKSPFAIAREWNQRRDLPSVHGGPWSGLVVEKILRRTTNERGSRPLLGHATHAAVLAVLDRPAPRFGHEAQQQQQPSLPKRRPLPTRIGIGKYVVTAVARCGVCGVEAGPTAATLDGDLVLGCRRGRTYGIVRDGQRHPTTLAEPAETAVIAAVVEALAEQAGTDRTAALKRFEILSIAEKRALANGLITAEVVPVEGKHRGWIKVSQKGSA